MWIFLIFFSFFSLPLLSPGGPGGGGGPDEILLGYSGVGGKYPLLETPTEQNMVHTYCLPGGGGGPGGPGGGGGGPLPRG